MSIQLDVDVWDKLSSNIPDVMKYWGRLMSLFIHNKRIDIRYDNVSFVIDDEPQIADLVSQGKLGSHDIPKYILHDTMTFSDENVRVVDCCDNITEVRQILEYVLSRHGYDVSVLISDSLNVIKEE